jgi:hypothetical protein
LPIASDELAVAIEKGEDGEGRGLTLRMGKGHGKAEETKF